MRSITRLKWKFFTALARHNTRENNKYSFVGTRQNCTAFECICNRSTSATDRKLPISFCATTIKIKTLCLIRGSESGSTQWNSKNLAYQNGLFFKNLRFFLPGYLWINSSYCSRNLNPLNAELNSICHLLAFLVVVRILQVSRIRVKIVSYRTSWW